MKMKEIKEWWLNYEMTDGSSHSVLTTGKARFTENHVIYKFEDEFGITECAISLDLVSAISCTGYFTEGKQ